MENHKINLRHTIGWIVPWMMVAVCVTLWLTGTVKVDGSNHRETVLLTQIESIGKLELVKYHISDVVEHKLIRQWLPEPTALLLISGEVVGCVDLSKISRKDILTQGDSLQVTLPAPEICYTRINHQESKVYSTQFAFWDEARLVDEAYKEAEKRLPSSAVRADILIQTKKNAVLILTPLFTALGFKSIHLVFR